MTMAAMYTGRRIHAHRQAVDELCDSDPEGTPTCTESESPSAALPLRRSILR